MKIILLGPPGIGKGTQAAKLEESLAIAHISTGDMLRKEVEVGSQLGMQVKNLLDSGQLVPDEMIVQIIASRIDEEDCDAGCILDGFPRTVPQAIALSEMLARREEEIFAVFLFELSKERLQERLASRRGEESRKDDTAEVQLERLKVYQEQTAPLIDYYKREGLLTEINAEGDVKDVYARLLTAIELSLPSEKQTENEG